MQTTTTNKHALIDKAISLLEEIDFSMLKLKLQDTEEGLGWTRDECDSAEQD